MTVEFCYDSAFVYQMAKSSPGLVRRSEPTVRNMEDGLVDFLLSRWSLFSAPNSDFFRRRLYEQIPKEVVDFAKKVKFEEMRKIPECYTERVDCPPELSRFFNDCSCFTILEEPCTIQPKKYVIKGVKPKKAYEISRFVEFLQPLCAEHGISRIVDVGCGIGHLLRAFNTNGFNFKLVGVECNKEFVETGRQISDDIEFVNVFLSEETAEEDVNRIFGEEGQERTAIVSLHGCGDLQPFLLKLFTRLSGTKHPLLATVACCYHKMTPESFPMNSELKISLPSCALRLACEQRLRRLEEYTPEDHEKQGFALIVKGIVECFYERIGADVSSKPRGFCRNLGENLSEVFDSILKRNEVPEGEIGEWHRVFNEIVDEHRDSLDFVQHYVIMQLALQGPLESLILSDRLRYLQKNGCCRSQLIPLFDSDLSPRNMAIIAEKSDL